jgi:hypothetical protein
LRQPLALLNNLCAVLVACRHHSRIATLAANNCAPSLFFCFPWDVITALVPALSRKNLVTWYHLVAAI